MPFAAGELCCSSKACVLLNVLAAPGASSGTWDKIPHVTNISVQQASNNPKLVTSSTKGKETSACGTVTQTGTLEMACHKGVGPGVLAINNVYQIAWAEDCDSIWDSETCQSTSFTNNYYQAFIRITQVPVNMNISGNQAQLFTYQFEVVSWVVGPDDYAQNPETDAISFDC
jgi:hypothetical protein